MLYLPLWVYWFLYWLSESSSYLASDSCRPLSARLAFFVEKLFWAIWWSCMQHCLFIFRNWSLEIWKDSTLYAWSCLAHCQPHCEMIPGWLFIRKSKNVNICKPSFCFSLWKHLLTASSTGVRGYLEVVGRLCTNVIVLDTGKKGSAPCFIQTFSCVFWVNFCRNKFLLLRNGDKAVDPGVLLRHGPPFHLPVHHIPHTMSFPELPTPGWCSCSQQVTCHHGSLVLFWVTSPLWCFSTSNVVEMSCLFFSLPLSALIFLQFFCIIVMLWVVANTGA